MSQFKYRTPKCSEKRRETRKIRPKRKIREIRILKKPENSGKPEKSWKSKACLSFWSWYHCVRSTWQKPNPIFSIIQNYTILFIMLIWIQRSPNNRQEVLEFICGFDFSKSIKGFEDQQRHSWAYQKTVFGFRQWW